MEFSALEPLNIDIQTQYIPLKPPLDKDNLWREFPPARRWGLFASQILKYCVEMEYSPCLPESPASLINDKQRHLVAICVLFLLENENGASKPSFLRTGNNSHLADVDVVQWQRREHVTELLPIKVAKAEAGLMLMGCRFLSAAKSTQITQNTFLGGEGRQRSILANSISFYLAIKLPLVCWWTNPKEVKFKVKREVAEVGVNPGLFTLYFWFCFCWSFFSWRPTFLSPSILSATELSVTSQKR